MYYYKRFIKNLRLFLFLLLLPMAINGWLLSHLGLKELYRVRHLSTHFPRAFLSIETPSHNFPTLIEAIWPEPFTPLHPTIFPTFEAHSNGNHSDCSLIQQSSYTQVDSLNRLWVLDIGWRGDNKDFNVDDNDNDNENGSGIRISNKSRRRRRQSCPPKLLAYDLLRNNVEILRIDCSKFFDAEDTNLLVVQLGPSPNPPCKVEKFIYFILANDPHLLAYDIVEQKWHRSKLLAKKYQSLTELFPIMPQDMTFGPGPKNDLLISDSDGKLYSYPLEKLYKKFMINEKRHQAIWYKDEKNYVKKESGGIGTSTGTENKIVIEDVDTVEDEKNIEIEFKFRIKSNDTIIVETLGRPELQMELIGNLLGPSKGMMCDRYGALFYVVPRFGAIVRAGKIRNLTTEGNEIIYLTSKNIQQIFFGIENSVWLLTDRVLKPNDHCFLRV